ncbi:MAG: LysR family transcriptional regulator [Gammaproteobacteria bacterium]|nr:LysR family transcriptional regulator [Gammaproteobacteria bacterium]MCW8988315.1 LysR family transcriptional regulator [Gammaproteobacteria bacterium]MCW9032346.1 LysR family transcriptional regulator [Gammaproteobacteria bacterium]
MHFTLQQLKLFEAVSRNGSYTRAAEELFLTQPAVSIQIKRLEEQVGLPLFELVGKKIFTTTAGKAMYQASIDILNRVAELNRTVEELKGEVKGPLQLAVVTTSKYFMPHLLGSFLQHYPDVEPKLKFSNRANVVERLKNNEDDFVVMGAIPEELNVESYPFLENIICIVASANHPLANKKNIKLKELMNERFLVREAGSGTRLVFDGMMEKEGLKMDPYMELGSSEAIKQGVVAGLGIAVLSLYSIALERDAGKLVLLDVKGFPIRRRWYAVHLKGKKLSLVAQTYLDYILNVSKEVLNLDYL